jgi:hypothetical protein
VSARETAIRGSALLRTHIPDATARRTAQLKLAAVALEGRTEPEAAAELRDVLDALGLLRGDT